MPGKIQSDEPLERTFIAEWREFRGITQEKLAELSNTTKQSISRIEAGKQVYTQKSLEAIARALRCRPADLLLRDPTKAEDWSIFDLSPENQIKAKEIVGAFKAQEEAAAKTSESAKLRAQKSAAKK